MKVYGSTFHWLVQHRHWFDWPVRCIGLVVVAFAVIYRVLTWPLEVLAWPLERLADFLDWALDWIDVLKRWSTTPDSSPAIRRYFARYAELQDNKPDEELDANSRDL